MIAEKTQQSLSKSSSNTAVLLSQRTLNLTSHNQTSMVL
ncbi:hypothetical protein JCM19233_6107 [Vibrio astriarenae]|nr:hypothetical protein JCM19233_6107 [Vibrio sp. C7]